jgi:DNA-directed RNA polymerase specialized sigma24 family protein
VQGGLSHHDAEDMVQDCLIQKWLDPSIHSYWEARRRSWKARRSLLRRPIVESTYARAKPRHTESVDLRIDVAAALDRLKPKQRDAMMRRFWAGEHVSARDATNQDRHLNASSRNRLRELLCSYSA